MYTEARGHRLEYRWLGEPSAPAPLVFLHEGLGSIDLWRDFPSDVVSGTGRRGLVYSRYGHGHSDVLDGARNVRFMHEEALQSLPGLVDDLVGRSPALIGHSDGASIALIYAGSGHDVEAMVLIAPHVVVEEHGLEQIRAANSSFATRDLGSRMAKYHRDAESTFRGWADVWLSERFRSWDLREHLPQIRCPILLIQSQEDDYGTLRHLDIIESNVRGPVQRLVVPGKSHSPHLALSEEVTEATVSFLKTVGSGRKVD